MSMERRRPVLCVIAPPDGAGLPPSAWPALASARDIDLQRLPPLPTSRLVKLLRKARPWAVLADSGPVGVSSAAACVRAGVPLVVRFHGRDAFGHRELAAEAPHLRSLFAVASAVVATSRDMAAQLLRLGADPRRLVWLPCGLELPGPDAAGRAAAALSSDRDPRGGRGARVLWVGRLDACQAPLRALDVFARVHARRPEARLTLVGDGSGAAAVSARLAQDPVLAGAVTLVADAPADRRASALAALFADADVVLATPERPYSGAVDATAMAALRAGAFGLPVVGTRHGGLPDVVLDGVTGRVCPEGDLDGLADALVALLAAPDEAARLGAAARARVTALFGRDTCERRLEALLLAVAAGQPVPAVEAELSPPDTAAPAPADEAELPSVSILIPAHGAEAWVGEAIDSALAQDLPRQEIVVVDDGSKDGTAAVLAGYGDRIRWETAPHRGGNATRNRLLELAGGEWLQFLDADDVLAPGKIRSQLRAAQATGADLVVSPALDGYGDVVHAPVGDDPWEDLLVSRLGITSSNLFRREAVVAAGGWKAAQAASQEYELMQRLLRRDARVTVVEHARTVKRNVNPRSVWVRDRRSSISAAERNLEDALAWLRTHDRFTPTLRALACRRFFRICQWRWAQGGLPAAGVTDLERRLDPDGRWLLAGLLPLHRAIYRALAVPPLRWVFRPAYKARMVWREKRKRMRARLLPDVATAAVPPSRPPVSPPVTTG